MFCESYRATLSEALLRGEQLREDAAAHLAACAPCRKWALDEQALMTSIEGTLRSIANTEVPASLVPKVRSRLVELPKSVAWRSPLLAYAAAALVLGAMVLLFGARTRVSVVPQGNAVREVLTILPAEPKSAPKQAAPRRELVVTHERNGVRQPAAMQAQPEVLISADEQLGLQRFTASLKRVSANRPALVKAEATTEIAPLEIAGIDVRRLSIEPLESGDAN
jgi:anti-sigma factor RsiW